MDNSRDRVRTVLSFGKPDRPAIFDLLPNDAILQHFNDGKAVPIGDDASAIRAIKTATDATRFTYFSPMTEKTIKIQNGQEQRFERWSIWTSHRKFSGSEEYCQEKNREMDVMEIKLQSPVEAAENTMYKKHRQLYSLFGMDYYFLLYAPCPEFSSICQEVGLEAFSYYLYDVEDIIIRQLQLNTEYACQWAKGLPKDDPFEAVFLGDDIAFKSGTMVSPGWMKKHYFPLLRNTVDAMHAAGKKVMFHSDGNLNPIMDELVDTGINVLNPIEVAAGMDLLDLHKRYPKLIFAGGIDASELLPFGSASDIRNAVIKAIEDTEGQILVGSSTEVFNSIPLKNYLVMHDAVMNYH